MLPLTIRITKSFLRFNDFLMNVKITRLAASNQSTCRNTALTYSIYQVKHLQAKAIPDVNRNSMAL